MVETESDIGFRVMLQMAQVQVFQEDGQLGLPMATGLLSSFGASLLGVTQVIGQLMTAGYDALVLRFARFATLAVPTGVLIT